MNNLKTKILTFVGLLVIAYFVFTFVLWDIRWVVNYDFLTRLIYAFISIYLFAVIIDRSKK